MISTVPAPAPRHRYARENTAAPLREPPSPLQSSFSYRSIPFSRCNRPICSTLLPINQNRFRQSSNLELQFEHG
jgi:hypothetical protein